MYNAQHSRGVPPSYSHPPQGPPPPGQSYPPYGHAPSQHQQYQPQGQPQV